MPPVPANGKSNVAMPTLIPVSFLQGRKLLVRLNESTSISKRWSILYVWIYMILCMQYPKIGIAFSIVHAVSCVKKNRQSWRAIYEAASSYINYSPYQERPTVYQWRTNEEVPMKMPCLHGDQEDLIKCSALKEPRRSDAQTWITIVYTSLDACQWSQRSTSNYNTMRRMNWLHANEYRKMRCDKEPTSLWITGVQTRLSYQGWQTLKCHSGYKVEEGNNP